MKPTHSASRHSILLIVSLFFAVPAYLVIVNSFKTQKDALAAPFAFSPSAATLDNYARALTDPTLNLFVAYGASTLITVTVVASVLFLGSMLAFVLGTSTSVAGVVIQYSLLVGLIIPPQVLILPVVGLLRAMNLMNSFAGLVFYDIATNLPLAVFVLSGFVRAVPRELREAALIDGARALRTFFSVYLPLLTAPLASIGVILAVFVWNDFLNPLIILGPLGPPTVTTGMYRAVGVYATDWSSVFTFAVLASVPMLVLFFGFQRYIISGLTAGALKG